MYPDPDVGDTAQPTGFFNTDKKSSKLDSYRKFFLVIYDMISTIYKNRDQTELLRDVDISWPRCMDLMKFLSYSRDKQ